MNRACIFVYSIHRRATTNINIFPDGEREGRKFRAHKQTTVCRSLKTRIFDIYIYIASRRHRLEEGKKEIFFFLTRIYRARNYRRYSLTNIDCFEATLAILINWPGVNYRIQRVLIYCPSGSLRCLRN